MTRWRQRRFHASTQRPAPSSGRTNGRGRSALTSGSSWATVARGLGELLVGDVLVDGASAGDAAVLDVVLDLVVAGELPAPVGEREQEAP